MHLTSEQFKRIAPLLPCQRGNVLLDNLAVLNAILFFAANVCKWRALPSHYSCWHTIYTRMSRWAKASVLYAVCEQLQRERLMRVPIEAVSLDSTIIKVHPDGTGALKKTVLSHWQEPGRLDYQTLSGCRGHLRRCNLEFDDEPSRRCA